MNRTPRPAERVPAPRRHGLPLSLLALVAVLLSVTSLGTYALWNDSSTVQGATITSGTLDLKVNVGAGDVDDVATWNGLQIGDIAPGESQAATLTVRNTGTTPATLTATGSAPGADLAPVMTARIYPSGAATTDTTYPRTETCSGTAAAAASTLQGSPALLGAGVALAPQATVTLCFLVALPSGAGNGLQNKPWTPTFTLLATQS